MPRVIVGPHAQSSLRPLGDGRRTRALLRTGWKLLANLSSGSISETAYDTAWVARVTDPDDSCRPAFPEAVGWLLRHQRPDGSWGGEIPVVHDRVVSTLAAVIALAERPGAGHAAAVARGVAYLARAIPRLQHDFVETVGFELILPALLARARQLDLELPYEQGATIDRLRADKLRRIPIGFIYTGPSSMTHSLEFLGEELQPELAQRCRAANGSYGASPSATACVLMHRWDEAEAGYIRAVLTMSNGGAYNIFPSEVFEKGWVLYHLWPLAERVPGCRTQVASLAAAWTPAGVGATIHGMLPDGDDTAIVLKVLRRHGLRVQPQALKLFEADDCFFTFALERNQSVTTNAHMLDALKDFADFPEQGRMMRKALAFLAASQTADGYWRDKWHVSPYYATGHTVLALCGTGALAERLIAPAVTWLLESQRANGSWSELAPDGTSEETAYALQALSALPTADDRVRAAARRASAYLWERFHDQNYPELWVDKGLYTPHAVVRAAIVGALAACERRFEPAGGAGA